MWHAGNRSEVAVVEDPDSRNVHVKLSHWPNYKSCTTVDYHVAEEVFSVLDAYPMRNDSIASPVCYRDGRIAYLNRSELTLDSLQRKRFPEEETYDTVRRTISAMMDMHEAGIGGLPVRVCSFVRTEERSNGCKLYYASRICGNCRNAREWEDVVRLDYGCMERFVRELIQASSNSVNLMKSVALYDHFIAVLWDHSNKSFNEKRRSRSLVLGHPLLMTYEHVETFLKLVGWSVTTACLNQRAFVGALSPITGVDWWSRVTSSANWRYISCLNERNGYAGRLYVEYCGDFLRHPDKYQLYGEYDSAEIIRRFEEFYPSYLGRIWVALDERGLSPKLS